MKIDKNMIIGLAFLGAVGIAVYLYFKQNGSSGFAGGSGGAPGAIIPEKQLIAEGSIKPNEMVVTHYTPTTTMVKKTGSFTHTYQKKPGSTRVGLITVGTPAQQIQQYNVAPKIVKIGGKSYKVM